MDSYNSIVNRLLGKIEEWSTEAIDFLPSVIIALAIVTFFGVISRYVERSVRRLVGELTEQVTIRDLFATLARVGTILVGTFVALGVLHLDKTVTSLLAGVGVLGLALGFAFQDIAANFVSGIIMIFHRPFADGDLVEIGGEIGVIEQIELRVTRLTTLNGVSISIPNKDVFQSKLMNYTLTDHRRVELEVGVAYSDDLREVREVALTALRSLQLRDQGRDVVLYFSSFGDSSINFTAYFWIEDPSEDAYLEARSEGIIVIKEAFDAAGITIPFPIRTLDFGADQVGGVALGATSALGGDAAA